jgi:hypothetical protein
MTLFSRLLDWWAFFRRGYGIYLSFIIGLIQFIIIAYTTQFIKETFQSLWLFTGFFILVVGSLTTFLGYLDYKYGSVVADNRLATKSNPATWDTVEASIFNAEALRDFMIPVGKKLEVDVSGSVAKIDKGIELFQKWRKD